MDVLSRFLEALGGILGDAGLWLLLGFGVAGLLHEFVPQRWLAKQLGSKGMGSVVKGTLIGAPLPLCSCSVIPAASALRKQGASKGAATAFAVSTPEIDVPAFSLTWALLGPVMAVARVIGAAMSAITAGLLVDAVSEKDDRPLPIATSDGCGTGCGCATVTTPAEAPSAQVAPRRSFAGRLADAVRYGFIDMPADLASWLVAGLVLSAVVGAFLPATLLSDGIGAGPVAILAAMGLGLVIYVCATGSTPLVAILVAKGLGPGPALAFLLAGPATNPAAMAWVLKDLGRAAFVAYIGAIAGVAFLSGLGMQWLALGGGWAPAAEPLGGHAGGSAIGGGVLAALLAYAVIRKGLDRLNTRAGLGRASGRDHTCCEEQPQATCCGGATPAAAASASTD